MDHKSAVEYALHRIRSNVISIEPFPHFVVRQVFPDDFYDQLVLSIPPIEQYSLARGWKKDERSTLRKTGRVGTRYDIRLSASGRRSPHTFFRDLTDCLTTPRFMGELATIAIANKDLVNLYGVTGETRLVKEVNAAYIAAHVDRAHRLVTVIFYLADPQFAGTACGTTLFRLEPDPFADDCRTRLPRPVTGELVPQKTVPFEPNSALVLPRYENSIHGVDAHICVKPRDTLHLYIDAEKKTEYSEMEFLLPP